MAFTFGRINSKQRARLEVNQGGRPQHWIRAIFIPVLLDPGLPEPARDHLSNVIGYDCPYGCNHRRIVGHELNALKRHIQNCEKMPQHHKGICDTSIALYLYIIPLSEPEQREIIYHVIIGMYRIYHVIIVMDRIYHVIIAWTQFIT